MIECPACSTPLAEDSTSCPRCGEPVDVATRPLPAGRIPAKSLDKVPTTSSPNSISGGRFVPGDVLAGRYRIVDLLGCGGMGEVYRAEDIKLRQAVALKFLPERLAHDPEWLNRLYHEVSNARQVSHRNVCRVYDIGEYGGQHFISMEYIRGEELSSLLKRIGRLPQDKAIVTARQLCAGLAAIHERGILHRDLKPSNVMIDDHGDVRITDFGVSIDSGGSPGQDVVAGTPAYMSPEQLSGSELSLRSDIYSLGLVLYELFTGKRAFETSSLAESLRLRRSDATPITSISFVKNLDPLIEKAILRCLEPDPNRRPESALQIAAALPGGDPLAAAMAMGETPSPEVIAAASKEGTLKPVVAFACLAAAILIAAMALLLADKVRQNLIVPLGRSPEVLRSRGSEIIQKLGYTTIPVDTASGWSVTGFINYVKENDRSAERWDQLREGQPPSMYFWYRESPQYLAPNFYTNTRVDESDPEMSISGMTRMGLDPQGRLFYFEHIPPQVDDSSVPASQPDWTTLFAEAGLNISNFNAAEPTWAPASACDLRAAWTGTYPIRPDIPIRIEAASFKGLPVYFRIIQPWTKPVRMQLSAGGLAGKVFATLFVSIVLATLFVGGLLARKNVRSGHGDIKGAFRLSTVIIVISMFRFIIRSSHVPTFAEFYIFWMSAMQAVLFATLFWILYMSLDPLVRRWWPHRIISWSRLLAGDWRDPLVGRDVLVGSLAGLIFPMFYFSSVVLSRWMGLPPDMPVFDPSLLSGIRVALGEFALRIFGLDIFLSLGFLFAFVVFYILLRREWLATIGLWFFVALTFAGTFANHFVLNLILALLFASAMVFVLRRFGFLSFFIMGLVGDLFFAFPLTTDPSAWYFDITLLAIVIYVAPVIYGFYTSLGGQKLFRGGLIPE